MFLLKDYMITPTQKNQNLVLDTITQTIDFCYTWIPSLAHVQPNSILLDLAKHGLTII